ncbi:MAG: hypothetical protein KKB59_19330 [Spirochaetes bacterium]|nr:hypothetical protein [Spirochaetota bacterium]
MDTEKIIVRRKKIESDQTRLNQAYGMGIEFALLDKKGRQVMPFVYCKDYLQDKIWSSLHKKPINIFGLVCDGKKNNVPFDKLRMAAKWTKQSKKMISRLQIALNYIRFLENHWGIEENSIAIEGARIMTDTTPFTPVVFIGPKEWIWHPAMVNLYALILRGCLWGEDKEHDITITFDSFVRLISQRDLGIRNSEAKKKGFIEILKQGPKLFGDDMLKNYPAHAAFHQTHNNGIQYYSEKLGKKNN